MERVARAGPFPSFRRHCSLIASPMECVEEEVDLMIIGVRLPEGDPEPAEVRAEKGSRSAGLGLRIHPVAVSLAAGAAAAALSVSGRNTRRGRTASRYGLSASQGDQTGELPRGASGLEEPSAEE